MEIVETPKREVNLGVRDRIEYIQKFIENMPGHLGEDPFPLKHSFAEGLYIREVFIPKGHFGVGKLHRDSYINICLSGEIYILSEEGDFKVTAPYTKISPPGSKKACYTVEDTIWLTVHANPKNLRDLDELDKMIHVYDYNDINDDVLDIGKLEFDNFMLSIQGG